MALFVVLSVAVASAGPAWATGSGLRPPAANPHGVSLTDKVTGVAPFGLGIKPADYPDTPFQVLYINGVDDRQEVDGDLIAAAADAFTAAPGTRLYVPLFNLTDVAPTVEPFLTTPAETTTYFFEWAVYFGEFETFADWVAIPIEAQYLVGR
jgi:hypothetical protein